VEGNAVRRVKLAGSSKKKVDYWWHFAIQAKLQIRDDLTLSLKSHVVFSDGKKLWASKQRMHRARRSKCRNWFNKEWRQKLLASVEWLTGNDSEIKMRVSKSEHILISKSPLLFSSPVSYEDPPKKKQENRQ
jgi:hypothetical protein